ncbi:MAG: hypothetical protein RLZZ246_1799, partial [Planctomycetota bacterium]
EYSSGQRGQTVNLLAYAYGGSNPSSPIPLQSAATFGGRAAPGIESMPPAAHRCASVRFRQARNRGVFAVVAAPLVVVMLAASPMGPPKPDSEAPAAPPTAPKQPAAPTPDAPKPDPALAQAYVKLVDELPKADERGSTSWNALSLDSKGLVADARFGDATVAQLTKSLSELQPVVIKLIVLTKRTAVIPPNAADAAGAKAQEIEASTKAAGAMRGTARLLTGDASRLFVAGKQQEASERLAACLGLVRQLANGSELHGLVGAGIVGLVEERVSIMRKGVAGRKLDAASKATILKALDALDPDQPFGVALTGQAASRAKLSLSSLKANLAP